MSDDGFVEMTNDSGGEGDSLLETDRKVSAGRIDWYCMRLSFMKAPLAGVTGVYDPGGDIDVDLDKTRNAGVARYDACWTSGGEACTSMARAPFAARTPVVTMI